MEKKKIYKRDTRDKIRVITVETDGARMITHSGLLINGKFVKAERVCKPKNIGRSNATTAEQQAEFEARAFIVKSLKEGYSETVREAELAVNLMPMLAKKADLNKLTYPVFVQPKLDGIRCVGKSDVKLTRKNREFETLDHINLGWLGEHILDGEMYAHGLSFQENTKLIKKYRAGETESVVYHVYDLPSHKGTFSKRYAELGMLVKDKEGVELVPTFTAYSKRDVLQFHSKFLDDGYEGTMIRTDDKEYEFDLRSSSLQKHKDFIDEAYTIIDVIPSDKKAEEGVVTVELPDGRTFNCGMGVGHDVRKDMLINKQDHIGKKAEVRFFEYYDEGIPRFPVYKGTRIDK